MHYVPLNYERLNLIEGRTLPSTVKNTNNASFVFWERSLFQRAASTIVPDRIPDEWRGYVKDFLYYCLFAEGFVPVWKSDIYGRTFQPATLSGRDWYYNPVYALVANPLLKESLRLEIGKDCEILKLTPDYSGIWDIISYYAEKLSLLDNAINMSLVNGKFSWILGARNKVAGQALKKIMDKVNMGDPAVIYDMKLVNDPTDKDSPFQMLDFGNIKEKYLTTQQLQDFQTLINNFDAEIGIPTVPYAKKERMVTDEAQSRQMDATSRCQVWVDCLNESADRIRALYPDIDLHFSMRYDPNERSEADVTGENNPDRNV